MQHISGYNLIQGAIGCSVASPLGAAKSVKVAPLERLTCKQPRERGAIDTGHFDHRGPDCSAVLV